MGNVERVPEGGDDQKKPGEEAEGPVQPERVALTLGEGLTVGNS